MSFYIQVLSEKTVSDLVYIIKYFAIRLHQPNLSLQTGYDMYSVDS